MREIRRTQPLKVPDIHVTPEMHDVNKHLFKFENITKSTNQIFGKHISKHLESPSEGSDLASWARHFPLCRRSSATGVPKPGHSGIVL